MSAAKHTPGPWLATCADEWATTKGEHAQFGRYDISAGSVDPAAENYYRIASVSNVNNALANKGNARLIAAAPELLDALQVLHDKTAELIAHLQATDRLRPCFNFPALDSARATIAKASGSAA